MAYGDGVVRLSVLDQSPIAEGSTGAQALRRTLDLARLADELGYHRFWVAEHHGGPMLASASPEALIGPIAQATAGIRVGAGGVMLPHYSPFKVAETFSVLAGLFGDRIDLGIGRAPGTDPLTALALQRDRRHAAPDDFPQQLAELLAYLDGSFPEGHQLAHLAQLPGLPERPRPWLLGSSPQSAVWAAELGLPYAYADFINPGGQAITADYRNRFRPVRELKAPETLLAVWALCAETEERALYLAGPHRMAFRLLRRGRLVRVPAPEEARRFLEEERRARGRPADPTRRPRGLVIGTPDQVRAQVEELAHSYGADEVMIVTITHDHADRRRSYELLAEAFDLKPRREPAQAPA
jgi:luciferase family oxidoreductase group 1